MESLFSSLKTARVRAHLYRNRDQARADVFDYVERFYNPRRRHSTIGYLSPVVFENLASSGSTWPALAFRAAAKPSAPNLETSLALITIRGAVDKKGPTTHHPCPRRHAFHDLDLPA